VTKIRDCPGTWTAQCCPRKVLMANVGGGRSKQTATSIWSQLHPFPSLLPPHLDSATSSSASTYLYGPPKLPSRPASSIFFLFFSFLFISLLFSSRPLLFSESTYVQAAGILVAILT
jgi:hypothetical protein